MLCYDMLSNTTSTKGTMDPEGSARNSCNNWPMAMVRTPSRPTDCFG